MLEGGVVAAAIVVVVAANAAAIVVVVVGGFQIFLKPKLLQISPHLAQESWPSPDRNQANVAARRIQ